ncbi:ABC transporter ATP-binding protein [Nocardioides sp. cx-173]|uniref:ABC transporter ATP-binding protein n=1 Tax=Nocardioides sp. cx-173 TaxID=2898796 RepID=UPI001E4D2DCB|nr:ABC transporter ATP-binding protein [Nocardioides sp. cx-173]MCD4524229.1 ABC transporter ATP-binding protein [Nocardioides sp. cx-173]UGB41621.1 ABC transporter ATP-binding protein [Nocardioides sp. cx-173]
MTETQPLLEVRNLHAYFGSQRGPVHAVDGVSFDVHQAQALGIVGESGSGKSVMSRAVMGLLPSYASLTGEVLFRGTNLLGLSRKGKEALWGNSIAMVFQDPSRSLNPVVKVSRQLTEGMRKHLGVSRSEASSRALDLLKEVGVPDPERRIHNYPHELSGGMRQRVMIAIALACEPELLIADEPTTALDVTIQRQILDLLRRIQRERHMALMLVSHDLAVVAGRTDRVAVMYSGKIAEVGSTRAIFDSPQHRYTRALLGATPTVDHERHTPLRLIQGSLPNPVAPPPGCRFAARCDHALPECPSDPMPALLSVGTDHWVACHNPAVVQTAPDGGVLLGR